MQLIREMGEPYGKLWEMLTERYGEKEASRVLSRILRAAVDHGEDLVAGAEHLEDRQRQLRSVAVPEALSGYRVESANATDYDWLLGGDGGGA